ncbi:MAG: 4-alpha-glucanotransferase, partial [Bacteroidota bacterium]|nr:4-alpha-glucanotransferase [Bacteroidota bacterium]
NREADWLLPYAAFRARKLEHQDKIWTSWPAHDRNSPDKKLLNPDLPELQFYLFEQFIFDSQWRNLCDYCGDRNIKIMGDLPIYVAHDSADVWASPELFQLDDSGEPLVVAGVPPDFFSNTGQRWGNPIYRWEVMAERGFKWWIHRMKRAWSLYDSVRLDHFRGFAGYWEIPATEEMENNSFPGMAVIQFGFDAGMDNPHLPHNYQPNQCVYTGTHDNDTLRGWWDTLSKHERAFAREYLQIESDENICSRAIERCLASDADLVITPVQDVLGLDGQARMNFPGTAFGNWRWRLSPRQQTELLEKFGQWLHDSTSGSRRLSVQN